MGLSPREDGGSSNEAVIRTVSSSMGNGLDQPSTSVQDDDHTLDVLSMLSLHVLGNGRINRGCDMTAAIRKIQRRAAQVITGAF